MSPRETSDAIEEAAVRWVWRLDREDRTPALAAELEAWLAEDPRRRGAFLQAEATWAMLDRGRQLAQGQAGAPEGRRIPRRAVLAGGGAIAASIAGLAYLALPQERYSTALGEIRRVPLKDGSTVAINTQSRMDVSLGPRERRVRLERGEAWFHVARNPDRPFVVECGEVRVRAVGTAFSVRREAKATEVLVTEGVVEVWVEGRPEAPVRVAAGEVAHLGENVAPGERPSGPEEIDRHLAWRSGLIDLSGETLGEAAADFNRYNARKLIIEDPKLSQSRFYGVFRTDDPEGFANAVRHSLGATVTRTGPDEIRISATAG